MRRAVCIGINKYPGGPLQGCINDVVDMRRLLTTNGYDVTTLLDEQATCAAIVNTITRTLAMTAQGDSVVISYSGHGTWVRDVNGDEPDGKDECLVPIDFDFDNKGTWLTDDTIAALIAQAQLPAAHVLFVFDACHAGTGTRGEFSHLTMVNEHATFTRFRHLEVPARFQVAARSRWRRWIAGLKEHRIGERLDAIVSAKAMVGLLSATTPKQLAADAYIAGAYHGAHTYALQLLLNKAGSLRELRGLMAHWLIQQGYNQTPTLYGSMPLRKLAVFA